MPLKETIKNKLLIASAIIGGAIATVGVKSMTNQQNDVPPAKADITLQTYSSPDATLTTSEIEAKFMDEVLQSEVGQKLATEMNLDQVSEIMISGNGKFRVAQDYKDAKANDVTPLFKFMDAALQSADGQELAEKMNLAEVEGFAYSALGKIRVAEDNQPTTVSKTALNFMDEALQSEAGQKLAAEMNLDEVEGIAISGNGKIRVAQDYSDATANDDQTKFQFIDTMLKTPEGQQAAKTTNLFNQPEYTVTSTGEGERILTPDDYRQQDAVKELTAELDKIQKRNTQQDAVKELTAELDMIWKRQNNSKSK